MGAIRIIPRLDVKAPHLIKGVHLEGLRVVGDPEVFALNYYHQGADELLYMDVVASLYGRNHLTELISKTAANVFIPITVGGGIRSIDDARTVLRAGADKVAINTAAVGRPSLISEIAEEFGSQCVVVSIEAKRQKSNSWGVMTNNGRESSNRDVIEWAIEASELGAGEILLTSIDQEGTRKGFDLSLLAAVTRVISVPVIASGGMGALDDMRRAVQEGEVQGVAIADMLHFNRTTIPLLRQFALGSGLLVRNV